MKKKMTNITKETSETDHDKMRKKNHHNSHTKSCIDICIDRSEIIMEPREKRKHPIKKETVKIGSKNVDKNTPNKPESFIKWQIMSEKGLKKSLHMFHNEKTCRVDKASLTFTSSEENSCASRYNKYKNPC